MKHFALALFATFFAVLAAGIASAQTGNAREARWRAEVEPSVVVGDAVSLRVTSDVRRDVFATTARIAAAHDWLKQKGYRRVVLLSHSMGAWMSNVYFQRKPQSPYVAWGVVGVTGRLLPFGENSLQVLDVYGERDLAPNLSWAWFRRMHLMLHPASEQAMIADTDHHHTGREKEVAHVVRRFIERLPAR